MQTLRRYASAALMGLLLFCGMRAGAVTEIAFATAGIPNIDVALSPGIKAHRGENSLRATTSQNGNMPISINFSFTGTTTFGLHTYNFNQTTSWSIYATGSLTPVAKGSYSESKETLHDSLATGLTPGSVYRCVISGTPNGNFFGVRGDSGMTLTTDIFGTSRALWPHFCRMAYTAESNTPTVTTAGSALTAGWLPTVTQDGSYRDAPGVRFNGLRLVGLEGTNIGRSGNLYDQSHIGTPGEGEIYATAHRGDGWSWDVRAKGAELWVYCYLGGGIRTYVDNSTLLANGSASFLDLGGMGDIYDGAHPNYGWVKVAGFPGDGFDARAYHSVEVMLARGIHLGASVIAWMCLNRDGIPGAFDTTGMTVRKKVVTFIGDSITEHTATDIQDGGQSYAAKTVHLASVGSMSGYVSWSLGVSGTTVTYHYVPKSGWFYAGKETGSGASSGVWRAAHLPALCAKAGVWPDYVMFLYGTNDAWAPLSLNWQIPVTTHGTESATFGHAYLAMLQNAFTDNAADAGDANANYSNGSTGAALLAHATKVWCLGLLPRRAGVTYVNGGTGNTNTYTFTEPGGGGNVPDGFLTYDTAIAAQVAAFGSARVVFQSTKRALTDADVARMQAVGDGIHPDPGGCTNIAAFLAPILHPPAPTSR